MTKQMKAYANYPHLTEKDIKKLIKIDNELKRDKQLIDEARKKGIDPKCYEQVFNDCVDYKKLFSENYHIGMGLHEMGLMEIKRVPRHKDNSFIGVDVFFKSIFK